MGDHLSCGVRAHTYIGHALVPRAHVTLVLRTYVGEINLVPGAHVTPRSAEG